MVERSAGDRRVGFPTSRQRGAAWLFVCLPLLAAAPASAQPPLPEVSTGQLVWSTSTPFIHVCARAESTSNDPDDDGIFLGTGDGGAQLPAGRYRLRGGPRFDQLWPNPTIVPISPGSETHIAIEYVSGAELNITGASFLAAGLVLLVTGFVVAAASGPLDECCSPEVSGLFIGSGGAMLTGFVLLFFGSDVRGIRLRTLSGSEAHR
jgi:hypothetical protein